MLPFVRVILPVVLIGSFTAGFIAQRMLGSPVAWQVGIAVLLGGLCYIGGVAAGGGGP